MVTEVIPVRNPISTVLERVGVHGFVGISSNTKTCNVEFQDEGDTMEMVQLGAERTKNVLILMSDTGGGHRASAEAIRDAFHLEFGDEYNGGGRLALMEYKPDIIISVHPLMQHIPLWVLKWQGLQKKVIFVTVITDLGTCHRTQFHHRVNRLYCPSEEVAKRALFDGLEESKTRVFGLPIRPSFCRASFTKDDLRVELEMDPMLAAVLLMGGGEGMGPVKKTAKALGEALFDKEMEKPIGQMVIICGRNEELVSTLQSVEWNIPVKIKGFQKQMEKWMGACDCIITKAGPGTIAEALIRGLPIILNDYIPGQEKGNVPYVVDNGAGVFTRSPKETARIVAQWFSTKEDERQTMSENALKLAQPNAVFDIVKDIHQLACQGGPLANIPYAFTSSFSSLI
ncbi:unnamed protein product [Withania somnifera]